jgi:hypothetical protein
MRTPVPDLLCWRCGASLADELLPFARTAECGACRADLHVCRLCVFYDTRKARHCQEPIAEEVKDKTRANFCDYFQPRPGAYEAAAVRASTTTRDALDALFDGPPATPDATAEAAAAQAALHRLFGKD